MRVDVDGNSLQTSRPAWISIDFFIELEFSWVVRGPAAFRH